jgi:hypothetical protein
MIALILSLFLLSDNMENTSTKTTDCGCAGHDSKQDPSVKCPCAAKKARNKRLVIIGVAVLALTGLGYWAFKTGKLSALWTWANTAKTV